MCYTYDSLNRVTARTIKKLSDDSVVSTETFTYDAAGNIVGASENTAFVYDTNNRLTSYNGNSVSYDMDGNMLSNGEKDFAYDSANRLISAGGHTYTYNAEDVRIRNLCSDADTTYVYDTNCKLSKLLCKTTNGITTKYVYGRGLIGEQKEYCYKIYHFDCRGSTVAITEIDGLITDTFAYDTYGKCISHVGSSFVIFGYNGRDGVVTDKNGLIYMRARYYSPEMKRFINADIVPGKLSNAITLNRFAYANGNPVSFVDPFGLSADNRGHGSIISGATPTTNYTWSTCAHNNTKNSKTATSGCPMGPCVSCLGEEGYIRYLSGEEVEYDEKYLQQSQYKNNSSNIQTDYEQEAIDKKHEQIDKYLEMLEDPLLYGIENDTAVRRAFNQVGMDSDVFFKGFGKAITILDLLMTIYDSAVENSQNGESLDEVQQAVLDDVAIWTIATVLGAAVGLYFGGWVGVVAGVITESVVYGCAELAEKSGY